MGNAKKILAKMRNHPQDWRIEDLKTLADHFGVRYRQNGTSHVFFAFAQGYLPVPAHRPIKPVYIRKFVSMLDAMIGGDRSYEEGRTEA